MNTSNRAIRFSISRIDVSKYGATNIGNTFTIPLTVWLGSSKSGVSKVAKIPGGDTIKITGQIRNSGVITYITASGDDFTCPVLGCTDGVVNGRYDNAKGTYTTSLIKWAGAVRNMATADAAFKFSHPRDYTVFRLKYYVMRNGSVIKSNTDMLSDTTLKNTVSADMDLSEMKYSVIITQPVAITGLQTGDEIRFMLENIA